MAKKLNNSEIHLHSRKKDRNGNQAIKLSFKGERGFSIQTNGNLPKTHSHLSGIKKFSSLSNEQLDEIEKEIIDYVSEYGTAHQKRLVGMNSVKKMSRGGSVEIGDYLKYPKATMIGEVIAVGVDSAIPDQKTVTVKYEDGKQVSDLLSSFEVVKKEPAKKMSRGGELDHSEIQDRLKSAGIPAETGDRIAAVEHLEVEHGIDPSAIVRALSDDKVYKAIKSVADAYELDLDDIDMSTGSRESVMEELSENQGFGYPELFRAMSDDDVFGAVHYVAINYELLEEPKEDVKSKFMGVTYIELAQGGFEVPKDSMNKVSYGMFDTESEAREHIESDLEKEESRKAELKAKEEADKKAKEDRKKEIEAKNEAARKRIKAKKDAKLKKELKDEMKALFNTYAGNYKYKPTDEFKSHIMSEMFVGDSHVPMLEGIYNELIKEYRDSGKLYEQGGKIKGRKKGCFEGHLSFLNW